MIALVRGTVAGVGSDHVVVDVGGVGYRVHVPGPALAGLKLDERILLHTQLVVRENELTLYGAPEKATITLFNLLVSVNGVGPRLALAMLSAYAADALTRAIAAEDVAALTQVSGVGRKTAQRVVLDLKGRLAGWAPAEGGLPAAELGSDGDAVAALMGLGYSAVEARQALAGLESADELSVEDQVLAALRRLSSA